MSFAQTPPARAPRSPEAPPAMTLPTAQVLDLMAKHGLSDIPIVKTMAFLADVVDLLAPASATLPTDQHDQTSYGDADRFVYMLAAEYRSALALDPTITEAGFMARRRAAYDDAMAAGEQTGRPAR